jgi:5-methylcytosine-specific restriction enzyme subunit McrC
LTLDDSDRIDLQPDLAARACGRWTFVGDIKYKRDAGQGQNADLYQLLAYATAARLSEGTLIYAEGSSGETEHWVRYAEVLMHVRRLNLAQPPREVLQQLAKIGNSIRAVDGSS